MLSSASYIRGPETAAFEEEFAGYCGTRHCVGVGNGLDAIELVLRGLGIGKGEEVLVPSNTFIATWLGVSRAGAVPVPVEPDPRTFNMDPVAAARAVTPRTRAIIPVHLYGQPADMDGLGRLARSRGLALIEDAAQAHGARFRGRRTGGLGHAAAFSFYPGKNLGAFGDGGGVTTNDGRLARKVRALANYGSHRRYHHDLYGANSRLDELQAAFLRIKLATLDEWNRRRKRAAAQYLRLLEGVEGLELPRVAPGTDPVWHLFVVKTGRREALRRGLEAAGVGTLIHYPIPPHRAGAYREARFPRKGLPVAERLARTVLSLPMGPHLGISQVDQVANLVKQLL